MSRPLLLAAILIVLALCAYLGNMPLESGGASGKDSLSFSR